MVTSCAKAKNKNHPVMATQESTPHEDLSADFEAESDIALMQRAGGGDMKAFEVLVQRHQTAVVGTAAKMLGSHSDACDIAQQVFIRAWKNAPKYRPTAKFTTWLMTITRNLVFNESRRKSKGQVYSLDEQRADEERRVREIPDGTQRPASEIAAEKELQAAIDRALAELAEKPRMALILRRYEDMSYEDIAETLQISVPATKSLIFRARRELRQKLAHFFE